MWYHFRANFYLQTSILSEWSKLRSNIIERKIPSKKEVAPPYNIHCFRTTGVLRRSPFLIWLRIMFLKRACYEFSVVIDVVNSLFFFGPESDHWLPLSVTHSLTNSLTDSCLVDLMAFYDANCLMMSQQLLYCGELFLRLEKDCVSCLHMVEAVKLLTAMLSEAGSGPFQIKSFHELIWSISQSTSQNVGKFI